MGSIRVRIRREQLFLSLLVLYIVNQVLSESQYINIKSVNTLLWLSRYTILAVLSAFILIRNKSGSKSRIIILFLLVSMLLVNLILKNGGLSFIPIVLFMWGSKNYSIEKMMRYSCLAVAGAYIFVIISAVVGIIEDNIDYRYIGAYAGSFFSGSYARHSVGFLVHNQVALTFLIVYLMIIAIWRENIKWYVHVVVMIVNYYIFCFFGSRVVFLLCLFTCFLYYLIKMKNKSQISVIERYSFCVYPILCCISFIAAISYEKGKRSSQILDLFFNNRLRLAKEAIDFFGIHILGSGQFAGTYNSTSLSDNTVDNGYIALFIQTGIIIAIIVIGMWMYITFLAARKNNRFLVLVLIILAVENVVNSQIGSYKLISFFCIFFNQNDPFVSGEQIDIRRLYSKKRKLRLLKA